MKKSNLIALSLMGMMMGFNAKSSYSNPKEFEPPKEPKKVIPKGCKEYHFTRSGDIVGISYAYIHFSCIALSEKKAKEKFKKHITLTGFIKS
jgi:hypothetical protein